MYLRNAGGKLDSIDFSYAQFWNSDWSHINLRKANLTGVYFDQMQFDGADFSQVQMFSGVILDRTAWWRASAINPELLAFLEKDPRHVFSADKSYPAPVAQNEYSSALIRLKMNKVAAHGRSRKS